MAYIFDENPYSNEQETWCSMCGSKVINQQPHHCRGPTSGLGEAYQPALYQPALYQPALYQPALYQPAPFIPMCSTCHIRTRWFDQSRQSYSPVCSSCHKTSKQATQGQLLCGLSWCPNAAAYDTSTRKLHTGCCRDHSQQCAHQGIRQPR